MEEILIFINGGKGYQRDIYYLKGWRVYIIDYCSMICIKWCSVRLGCKNNWVLDMENFEYYVKEFD